MIDKTINESIIMQMLYGKVGAHTINHGEKYHKLSKEIVTLEEKLMDEISKDENLKAMLKELINLYILKECEACDDYLLYGYKLGFLTALEVAGFTPPKDNKQPTIPKGITILD